MLSVLLGPRCCGWALLAVIGIVVGFVFGVVPALWVVIVGLLMQLAVHMNYASRLAAWLESPRLDDIPNGWGLWADVFARLYRQRRTTEINERRLRRERGALPPHDQCAARRHRAGRCLAADRLVQPGRRSSTSACACRPTRACA